MELSRLNSKLRPSIVNVQLRSFARIAHARRGQIRTAIRTTIDERLIVDTPMCQDQKTRANLSIR